MVHSGCSVSKLTITHVLIEGFCSGSFLSFSLRPASSIVAIHVLFYTSRHTLDLSTTVVNSKFFRIFGPERRVHICRAEVECMTRGREKGFFHLAIISGHEGTWDSVMHSDYTYLHWTFTLCRIPLSRGLYSRIFCIPPWPQ